MFFITPPNNYYNPVFKLCNWLNSNLYQKIDASMLISECGTIQEINGVTKIEIIAENLVILSLSILMVKECQSGEVIISNIKYMLDGSIALNNHIYELSDVKTYNTFKARLANTGDLIAIDAMPKNTVLRGCIIFSLYGTH